MTPAWLDTAVIVEVRLDTASIGGKFQDSRARSTSMPKPA